MDLKQDTLLIVDDEELIRQLLRVKFSGENYQCLTAVNGIEAIELIKGIQIAVVLLDINMPGKTGIETLQDIKTLKPDTEVIMATAINDIEIALKCLRLGAYDYVIKPFNLEELIHITKRAQEHRRLILENRSYQLELEKKVSERTEELRQALDKLKTASLDTIFRLSRAAEYKDEDTGMHIRRIGRYAAQIAETMGLPAEQIESFLYAAPMHDIGKIGIPDHILLKPGTLTPQEWEIMKQHTIIGANILEGAASEIIKQGAVIALNHHEKWDGSGYPNGLKGENIPLAGRITAIVDVFDALTSKRPYRLQSFSVPEALKMIEENVGKQFDPEIYRALQGSLKNILAIKEHH
ncbi:HD domain-containing phosphohydrolase [Dehalococcoides mccartyi]|jgi:putative two-component system response regulator|uniref:Response regulator protein n=2 Tax=Dehalococcoides mccartyi TaxID=61435 RepID=A0A142VCA4_9CHLR|nr:HD domain-containing phosphohydrolase [Dehalococcoides mccartyi]AII61516.1 chemotaxis protein CheY [Dehalococcoides mccartyi CG5]AMU87309.1 response regulator protein [Dehalococcoides mccartyi]AQX73829.1 two-component system response regulator [Dehalococcoides mccartyi]MBA2084296.1 Response regulator [Dehalococcoides mccartyi]QBX64517.1 response regulator [Dehalococcoides mccartyi]